MLRLTNVRKRFGEILAVDDLTLRIEPREIFGLLGPNGAGKSTSINLAVGLLRPDRGTVEIDGAGGPHGAAAAGSPLDAAVRRRIGVAPQSLAVYEELTARENLRFFGSLYGLHGPALRRRTDELLALTGLADRGGDRVGKYSGGMKRRLNLAAALVHDPALLLLDEPTAGVDPQSRHAIFEMVRALRDEGRTIIYTTHYMEEAQRLCDRVGIVDHGRLLALGTVEGLIAAHGGRSLLTVSDGGGERSLPTDDPLGELRRVLAAPEVVGVRLERPSLESVFLGLTGRSLRD